MSEGDKTNPSEFDAYRTSYAGAVNDSIAFSGLNVDFFARAKAARLVDLLHKMIGDPRDLSILDVGCGVGTYHSLLRGKVGRVSGVDPSNECIAQARINNPDVEYKASGGELLPYNDGEFDASFAICVMHHVPVSKWAQFSAELARVTRPGGVVVLFEHNPFNPLTRRAVSNCPFDEDAVLLSKRTATGYFARAGLHDVQGKYILTIPSVRGFLRTADDSLGFIPTGAQYYIVGRR
jgi:SAM-dependent methyltransferase